MRVKESKLSGNKCQDLKRDRELALWWYNKLLIFFCLAGLSLSLYAYVVELSLENNKLYKPYCDVNSQISCTKTFTSSYGKGFGVFKENSILYKPNSFFGIMFYSILATFSLVNSPVAINSSLLLIILANFASLYLAYIMYFVLKHLCLVCISTYFVNVMLFILIFIKQKMVRGLTELSVESSKDK